MSNLMNKHESKYFNTARLMNDALLFLLEKKEYSFITVKDICQKAGVNRSTFYLHYETMNDLLEETLAYSTKSFEEQFQVDTDGNKLDPMNDLVLVKPQYILPYLRFLKQHKKACIAAMSQPKVLCADKYFDKVFLQVVTPILQKLQVPANEQQYVAAFYTSGLHNIAFAWVKGGCKEDENFICEIMMKYTSNGNKPCL